MEQANITYTVIKRDNGRIALQKDGCTVFIPDTWDNLALISSIETDLKFELKKLHENNTIDN